MSTQRQQFLEDMGQYMVGWGLPRISGRIYGCLLLQREPVSLDQIAADLGVAKSGASVAIRQLMALGLARSISQRGSRRLLYEVLYDLETIFDSRNAQMLGLVDRLRQGARVAPADATRERLIEMAAVVEELMDGMRDLVQRTRARRLAS